MKCSIINIFFLSTVTLFLFTNCKNTTVKTPIDTVSSGTIHISVDESFRPVIESEINVFEALYPNAHILAQYKPEAECFKDLYNDSSIRMIIVTRGFSKSESHFYQDSLGYTPVSDPIASDGIAIVVNKNSNDTLFSKDRLQKQMLGKLGTTKQFIFDGLSTTSTVRYAIDSILKGNKLDTNVVKGAKNSIEVLNTVANNLNAIGLVGISWIGNKEDTAQVKMLKKVKLAYVQCDRCVDTPYVFPTQLSITTKRYSLVRSLYYILKENYSGLGSGFSAFLKYEKGQLIFRRAYLVPEMNFGIRTASITE